MMCKTLAPQLVFLLPKTSHLLLPGLWSPAGTVEALLGFQLTHKGEMGSCVSFSTSEMVLVKLVRPVL